MLLVRAAVLERKALHPEIPVVAVIVSSGAWGHHLPDFQWAWMCIWINAWLAPHLVCFTLFYSVLLLCLASQFIFFSKLCFRPEEQTHHHSPGNRNLTNARLFHCCQVSLLSPLPNEGDWRQTLLLSWLLRVSASMSTKAWPEFLFGCVLRHLWGQEGALSWPCSKGWVPSASGMPFYGSLSHCFSLWAALLRLKRTEQHKLHFKGIFLYSLATPEVAQSFYSLSILTVSSANLFWLQSTGKCISQCRAPP